MLVDRYLAREVAIVLSIIAPTLCLLVVVIQAMRWLPLIIAADLDVISIANIFAMMCIPLSTVALPTSAVLSILAVFSRLESDGELIALRACGAGSLRLSVAPAVICAAVAVSAGLVTLFAEPMAYNRLGHRLGEVMVSSALGRVRPGVIAEPVPELTVLATRRRGKTLEQVFIEDRRGAPAALLVARTATLEPVQGRPAVRLVLEDGTAQSRSRDGVLTRASFGRLEATLELEEAVGSGMMPPRFGLDLEALRRAASTGGNAGRDAALLLHRRLAVAPGAFGLCLLALLLGLRRTVATKTWAMVCGAGLVLCYHLASRAGEALVETSVLSPEGGGWLPVALCWSAVVVTIALRKRT